MTTPHVLVVASHIVQVPAQVPLQLDNASVAVLVVVPETIDTLCM